MLLRAVGVRTGCRNCLSRSLFFAVALQEHIGEGLTE